jgi:type III secretion system FlhB-like substrate exporter
VNPTHFAVALYYEPGATPLPRVVAKGVDAAALKIRKLAERSGVPVLEDRLLARRLYSDVPVGQYIRDELIDAVAAVFRWLKLMQDQRRGSVDIAVAETESHPAHSVNQPGEVGPVDLAAKPGDMHVNDIVQGRGAPHVFPDLMR